ncbi:hypothetical protein EVAR_43905_1 [Eumeta japonica]|uniref:Uncharacterized protein n=1 Tax=Eumeta variegata TaxID=151549 RepID=A0A4C1WRG7_EUMVA|nr:hypothetical protein EVAR_43905_1 [Eumeta japonica]
MKAKEFESKGPFKTPYTALYELDNFSMSTKNSRWKSHNFTVSIGVILNKLTRYRFGRYRVAYVGSHVGDVSDTYRRSRGPCDDIGYPAIRFGILG